MKDEMTIDQIDSAIKSLQQMKEEMLEDRFKDLKRVKNEGAIIEVSLGNEWFNMKDRQWRNELHYRIKGGISLASWDAHKNIIKQWWNGTELEWYDNNHKRWSQDHFPKWGWDDTYRVKENKWKLPEYEDGAEWTALTGSIHKGYSSNKFTEAGRRRTTRALAERCAKASKTRDLLEAWRDHLEPEWVDRIGKFAYYLILVNRNYRIDYDMTIRTVGTVYGSEETMTKICNALNDGTISLED